MWRWCAGGRWTGAEARRAIKLKQTHDIVFSRHRAPGSLQGTDGRLCVLSQTSHQPSLTPQTKASEKDAPSWCLQCHPVRDGGAGIFSLPMVISKHLICAVACPSRSDPRGRVLVAAASLLSVIFFCTSPWWWWWCWLLVGHVNMLHVNRHARADRRKATKNGLHFAPPNCRVILSVCVCVHVCVCVCMCV